VVLRALLLLVLQVATQVLQAAQWSIAVQAVAVLQAAQIALLLVRQVLVAALVRQVAAVWSIVLQVRRAQVVLRPVLLAPILQAAVALLLAQALR